MSRIQIPHFHLLHLPPLHHPTRLIPHPILVTILLLLPRLLLLLTRYINTPSIREIDEEWRQAERHSNRHADRLANEQADSQAGRHDSI